MDSNEIEEVGRLRAVLYLRYSSPMQKEASLQDQERQCRKVAEEKNWGILGHHVYSDQAKSGTSLFKRKGLQKLMADAEAKPRPFDVVMLFETSRLARNLEDILRLTRRLDELGIRVYFVGQGLDSNDSNFRPTFNGLGYGRRAIYREFAAQCIKGQEGQVLKGFISGGRCFGYENIRVADGTICKVVDSEAKTINRIYELYAGGMTVHQIVRKLTVERVPAARKPKIGHVNSSWNHNLVQRILRNERYVGMYVWNKTHQRREHDTGRVIFEKKSAEEHKRVEHPDLRIVSDQLWTKVQERRKIIDEKVKRHRLGGINRAQNKSYLFSGLLRCGVCGEAIVITGGKGSEAAYGCKAARYMRGCTNKLRIRQDRLAAQLLRAMADNLFASDMLDYLVEQVCQELNDRLQQEHKNTKETAQELARQKAELETRIAILWDHLEVTPVSEATDLKARLRERRAELQRLEFKTAAQRKDTPTKVSVDDTRRLVAQKVANLMEVCSADIDNARQMLQELIGTLVLYPVDTPGGPIYEVMGNVDLFASRESPGSDVMLEDSSTRIFQHYKSFRHGFVGIQIDPALVGPGEEGPAKATALRDLIVDLLGRKPGLQGKMLRADEWAGQFMTSTTQKYTWDARNIHCTLRTHPGMFRESVDITSGLDGHTQVRRYAFRLSSTEHCRPAIWPPVFSNHSDFVGVAAD